MTHDSCEWNTLLYFKVKIEQKFTKSPNWKEANQLAIYKAQPKSWTRNYREMTKTYSGKMRKPGPACSKDG